MIFLHQFRREILGFFVAIFVGGSIYGQSQFSDLSSYDTAQAFEKNGDFEGAYIFYEKSLSENEKSPEKKFLSVYKLAQIVEKLRIINSKYSWKEAQKFYLQAHSISSFRAEPLVRIAIHYFRGMTEEEQKNILLKDRMQLAFDFATWAMKVPCLPDNLLPEEDRGLCEIETLNVAAPAASYIGECEKGEFFAERLSNMFPNNLHLRQNLNAYKTGTVCVKDDYLKEVKNRLDKLEESLKKKIIMNKI